MRNSIQMLAGQTAIYGLGTILPRLLNFAILTPFYTRVLGEGSYGTVTEIYAYVVVVMVIITFGMETGFFRFASGQSDIKKVYSHAFGVVFVLAILWLTVISLFLTPIAGALRYPEHPEYIKWFAWIIALDAIASIPFAKMRQENRPRRFATLKLSMVVLNIAVVMILLWIFPMIQKANPGLLPGWIYNPEIGVGYVFITNLITSILMFLLLIPELRDLRWGFDRQLLIKMVKFSAPLVIVGLAGAVNDVADKILLKFVTLDPELALSTVGIYGGNYRMAVIMTLYIQMFRYAFEPFLFSIAGDRDAKATYARVMKYFVILGLLIFLGVMFYMDGIKYFLPARYHKANGIVPIILMANLLLGIYYSLSVWYKVTDKTRFAMVIAGTGATFTLLFNMLLIPVWGYWASAWATLGCYLIMVIISYLWGRKVYPVPYETGRIAGWILLAVALFGLSEWISPDALALRLLLNTILLILFIVVIGMREKDLVRIVLIRAGIMRA